MPVITCSNENKCYISFKEKDNELITVLDFKVKSYKILNHGWKEYDYPDNIIIEDKLYLNEKMLNKIIDCFDNFIKYSYITQNKLDEIENFRDLKGNKIRIYNSSSIEDKLWFGADIQVAHIKVEDKIELYEHEKGIDPFGNHKKPTLLIPDRLHLKKNNVERLLKMFNKAKVNHQVNLLEKELKPKTKIKKVKV